MTGGWLDDRRMAGGLQEEEFEESYEVRPRDWEGGGAVRTQSLLSRVLLKRAAALPLLGEMLPLWDTPSESIAKTDESASA